VIWMIVTPLPIMLLRPVALATVRAILSMLLGKITAVRVVFTVIPVVIILVVAIVDSDLYAGVLR
jgi:hypothetical protein